MPLIVRKLLFIQLVALFITMLAVFFATDKKGACAALIGGAVGMLATWVSAKVTFAGGSIKDPKKAYRALLLGEGIKFGVVIAALSTAFILHPGQAGSLLIGLAVTLLSYRVGMILSDKRDFTPRT